MNPRNRPGRVLLVCLTLALSACGNPSSENRGRLEQSGPVDDETEEESLLSEAESGPVEGQTGAIEAGSQCGEILDVTDGAQVEAARQNYMGTDLVAALEEIPAVSHVASAMQTPDAREEFTDLDEVTVFAPISSAFHERAVEESSPEDENESADDDSYTQWPATTLLRAHFVVDESHSIGGLLDDDRETVMLADGSTLEILENEGVVSVSRDGITADVICGDIEVEDGFIHVIDTVLFETDETDVEDDVPGSNQEVPFRGSDAPGTDPPQER